MDQDKVRDCLMQVYLRDLAILGFWLCLIGVCVFSGIVEVCILTFFCPVLSHRGFTAAESGALVPSEPFEEHSFSEHLHFT